MGPSRLPQMIRRPSGEKATVLTPSLGPLSVIISRPLSTAHSLTVMSSLPLTKRRLSGEKAIELIHLACPRNDMLCAGKRRPVAASHTLMVKPHPPAIHRPSGEQATQ